jgi:hypothetical protein
MKRVILLALALVLFGVVAPAIAADYDLKTSDGVQKFFQQIQHNGP